MIEENVEPKKVKDFSYQDFSEEDQKDFFVRGLDDDNMVIPPLAGLDDSFHEDMFNFGDAEDLPDSDRETICRQRKVSRKNCFDI